MSSICFVFGYWAIVYQITLSLPYTDSPRDSVQFMEWSPAPCPRALLIANFHGRITIWTQPSQVSCYIIVGIYTYCHYGSSFSLHIVNVVITFCFKFSEEVCV